MKSVTSGESAMSHEDQVDAPCDCETEARRSFLAKISILMSGVIGAIIVLPGIGFVLAPVFGRSPQRWRSVGKVDEFKVGATVLVSYEDPSAEPWSGVTAKTGAWLRRVNEGEFIAFSINCRHLGCPVRWVDDARLFMCPCHGGVYYEDGTVAGGPPPKPLARLSVRMRKGEVEIETGPVPLTLTKV